MARSLFALVLVCCSAVVAFAAPPAKDMAEITTLTVAEAESLIATEPEIILESLASLSPDVARVLIKSEGGLCLDGLTTVSNEVAAVLAEHKHVVCLNGLKSLTPAVARTLAQAKGGILALNGLTGLSPEVAEELSKHKGWLFLGGIAVLTPEVISPLTKHNGDVTFGTKGAITPEAMTLVKANNHMHIGKDWLLKPIELLEPANAAPVARQWTTRSGKALGTGSFIGLDGEHVRIQLASGKVGRIAKDKLSEDDIRFVENASAAAAESEELVIEAEGAGAVAAQPLVHSPPAGPSPMLVATRAAWRGLQEADAKMNKAEFSLPSERCSATAFAYSQIPLANADPILVRHIQRSMEAQKAAAQVCLRYESEMKEIQARIDNAAGVGALIGGAASEPGTAQANAAGLALLFGGFAQASATSEAQAAFAKMEAAWKNIEPELEACTAGDIEVAKYLSEKYGEPFLDAF